MKRVAIYCLDQDPGSTSSLGILNFTTEILRNLATDCNRSWQPVILISENNRATLLPEIIPEEWEIVELKGGFGTGFRRVVADQLLSVWLSWRNKCRFVWFPKGWSPLLGPLFGLRTIVTLHDTIPLHYLRHHSLPALGKLKSKYFSMQARWSVRTATIRTTISRSSAKLLSESYGSKPEDWTILPMGARRFPAPNRSEEPGTSILVFGSRFPHKRTSESLRLLDEFLAKNDGNYNVNVVGLSEAPQGVQLDGRFSFLGRVSDSELSSTLAAASVTVLLSEIEGFGLPLLESYSLGTPVVFRNEHAFFEVGKGLPGAFDATRGYESFEEAMLEVLALPKVEISTFAADLHTRYNWRRAARLLSQSIEVTTDQ